MDRGDVTQQLRIRAGVPGPDGNAGAWRGVESMGFREAVL